MTNRNIIVQVICLAVLIVIAAGRLYAVEISMSGIIACPVPFNPKKEALQIGDVKGTITGDMMEVEIFDINGDTVFKRTVASDTFSWSGYNSRGKLVKPGMYIIRVIIETSTGGRGEKIIRILVNY